MRQAISVPRANLISLGVCLGKFSKTEKFRLHVTGLDILGRYAKNKVSRSLGCPGEEGDEGSWCMALQVCAKCVYLSGLGATCTSAAGFGTAGTRELATKTASHVSLSCELAGSRLDEGSVLREHTHSALHERGTSLRYELVNGALASLRTCGLLSLPSCLYCSQGRWRTRLASTAYPVRVERLRVEGVAG